MATYTLTGNITDLVSASLDAPNVEARAYLIPYSGLTVEGTDVRVGGVLLDLDDDGSFSQSNIPGGGYRVEIHYRDPVTNQLLKPSSGFFELSADSALDDVIETEPYVPPIPGGITESEVVDIASDIAADLDDASALRQAFGSVNEAPISPWQPSPTFGQEWWQLSNFQGGYNTTDLTPSLVGNSTSQSVRTRIAIGNDANSDTSWRLEFDYDLSTLTGGGWAQIAVLLGNPGGTALAGFTEQTLVTQYSPRLTGHYIFDFQPETATSPYLEVKVEVANNVTGGTIEMTNVSLKRTGHVSRPMLVTKQSGGGTYPYVYWQQRNVKTDVWQVASLTFEPDGNLTNSYGQMFGFRTDAPWNKDPADPAFQRTTLGITEAVNGQQETESPLTLHVGNNDQILHVWNGSAFELRGNTHNGEYNRSAAVWKVDRGTGAGFVPWTLSHGLDPIRRFQVDLPTEMRRSVDGTTPFLNVDHKFTLFPDGMLRCDRTSTFLSTQLYQDFFEWMTSHEPSTPWIGRVGRGSSVIGEVDIHAKLATPAISSTSTATTGGTLAAATYSYRVAALSAQGETLGSVAATRTTTGSASTVTVNWGAISGAVGYAIYRGPAGFERLLTRVGVVTTYIDTGANVPDATRAPVTVSSARTGSVALDAEVFSDATWAVIQEPLTGWCFGNIYDRDAVLSRPLVKAVRTRLEAGSGIVKNYMNLFWNGSDTATIPAGTVWTATHWAMAYLPADPAEYHREIAVRAANLGALKDLYPIT